MLVRTFIYALLLLSTLSVSAETGEPIRTAADLFRAACDPSAIGRRFDVTVTMSTDLKNGFLTNVGEDDTGAMTFLVTSHTRPKINAKAGSVLRLRGRIIVEREYMSGPFAFCETIEFVGKNPPPEPVHLSGRDFHSGKADCRLVTLTGTVRDVVSDEIDTRFVFLILSVDDETIYVPLHTEDKIITQLTPGTVVTATGVCSPFDQGGRRQVGRMLHILAPTDIKIVQAIVRNPFDAPLIDTIEMESPKNIACLGHHRAIGRVLAVWNGNTILLHTAPHRCTRIDLSKGPLPAVGTTIEATGYPESDLYRINLTCAQWRPAASTADNAQNETEPVETIPLCVKNGKTLFDPFAHGSLRRLTGIVRTQPTDAGRFSLDCNGHPITVDLSSVPEARDPLVIGYRIQVSGICVMESDNWRPNRVFPKIKEAVLVVRTADDILVLERLSWWTVEHLLAVIGVLTLLLLGILAWNASLRILAQRRGRELFKSQIAKVSSELRVSERTRLAVELHDSITQNLTGVTLQLDAAASARNEDPSAADVLLVVARRTLQSCLDELRRCLWDLRSEAMEEPDFNRAIRIAIKQVAARADINVRFSVNRAKLSDASAHAILRIIRELVSNAVRHGKATKIRIAGETLPDRIHFAVTDNGCGFDEAAIPGPGEGHFGIAGIRERLKALHGTVNFTSSPEKGTRVEISIRLPHPASAS